MTDHELEGWRLVNNAETIDEIEKASKSICYLDLDIDVFHDMQNALSYQAREYFRYLRGR